MHSGLLRARQFAIFFFLLLTLSLLIVRLAYLQIVRYSFYAEIARDQHTTTIPLEAKRGTIFDRELRVLGVNLKVDSVYANPKEIVNKAAAARTLAGILGMNEKALVSRLGKEKGFVWIKRKVTNEEADAVKRAKVKGVYLLRESKRFYPNSKLASHVIGTANIDNLGLEGVEKQYDRFLKGSDGWSVTTQDGRRRKLKLYHDEVVLPRNGLNVVLTIDEVIQHIAEVELEAVYSKLRAAGATIVVMDPFSGEILAMASLPQYDLNDLAHRPALAVRNRAICDFFEPGSIFKIVTASAALEERVVTFDDTFFCEYGEYKVGRRILHDHKPHGTLTFREVIELSSNIGTVKVASLFGPKKMFEYVTRFGFREKTDIDLPGEVVGMNRDLSRWSRSSMYAIPMGQEVTTTAVQMVRAVSIIANGGYLVRPHLLREVIDGAGETITRYSSPPPRRVISSDTAAKVRELLAGVVASGTGKKAKVEEYPVAGKTGTAQKVESNGTYSHSKYIASFIGFAPAEKPRIAIVVFVDEPHIIYFGGDVSAPVFSKVAAATLKYLNAKDPSYVLGMRP